MKSVAGTNYIAGFMLCIVSATGWANSGTEHPPTYITPTYPSWPIDDYDGGLRYNAIDPAMPYTPGLECGSSCHGDDGGYSGSSSLSGELAPAVGETNSYTLSFSSNAVENGFSLTVRNSQGSRVGQFTSVGAGALIHDITTGVKTTSNNHITHSTPKANPGAGTYFSSWTFNWKAPSGPGAIGKTFIMSWCVNQVNGDGDAYTNTGDPDYFSLDGPTICDSENIVVTNTPPNATNNTTSTNEDNPVNINVKTAGVADDDGDANIAQTLTVTAVTAPANPAPNGTTIESGATDGLVTYNPNAQFESLAFGSSTTDVFTYTLSDGLATGVGTVTVTINGVNDDPAVAVDASVNYQEADPATVIDPSITITDVDTGSSINGAEVQITGANYNPAEDVLACGATPAGILCAAFDTVTGKLVLSGSQSKANYELALEAVTYVNTSLNPTVNTRTISFRVLDDQNDLSADDTASIAVSSISTPPSSTGFTGTAGFTEGDTVTPGATSAVVLDDSVTLLDPDSDLSQVILEITAGTLVSPQDQLLCPASLPLNGLSCVQGAGKVTLSSATSNTLSEYQAAIAGVKYNNISNDPDTSDRTVELTVRDSSNTLALTTPFKTITVAAKNDSPTSINVPVVLTATEESQYSFTFVAVDPDDVNDGSGLTYSIFSGAEPGMAVDNGAPNNGRFTWTPPRTNTFNDSYNFVVQAADGGENGSAPVKTSTITLSVSPPDADSDGVSDYSDNCPGDANGIAGDNQADNDNDTQYMANAGFPAIGDVDTSDPATGGDACDTDDDNDGMLDTDEASFPGCLDPFDPSDATGDCDGDGVNNITEVNDGDAYTSPDADSVGPTVNAPSDITVDATGLLTTVNLGTATGSDGNDGASTIFKAAVDLSAADLIAFDTPVTGCQAFSDYEADIEPFRPGSHTITWATCDASGNSGRDSQTVNVKPLVSIDSGQSIGEGQPVSIDVVLNGDAIAYPAKVKYTITGTATPVGDHDGVSGEVTFNNPGDIGAINFNTLADAVAESDETVVVTLHTPSNMALSNSKVHTVTITEANVTPQAALVVTQPNAVLDVNKGHTLYQVDGVARVVADASDGNGDTLSYDWSATDPGLLAVATITSNQIDFDTNVLTAGGVYNAKVTVSDGQSNVAVERLLLVKAGEVNAWLIGDDDDGDGIDNLSEGYGDGDADGVPDYLDHASLPANAIQNHTVNLASSQLIETDPGLHIAKGETAIAAQATGLLVGLQDILDHGGAGGVAVINADTDHAFYSGLLNFEISGLTDDIESVHVVIPLQSGIQQGSVYRKFNGSGWFDFFEDDLNELRRAAGNDGSCLQPGSNLYSAGRTVGHLCLQLTIQDGGSNDADGVRNYIVKDPGGLALAPEVEEVPAAADDSGRVGSLSLWFILVLSMAVVVIWRLRIKQMAYARTLF